MFKRLTWKESRKREVEGNWFLFVESFQDIHLSATKR